MRWFLLLSAGCSSTTLTIPFAAEINDTAALCGTQYTPPLGSSTVELLDLRLYVSDLTLITDSGKRVVADLSKNDPYQRDRVALLDFEDATGLCRGTDNPGTHTQLELSVPDDTYTGIEFTVGVPEDLNHLDSANSPSPLDNPSMYWAWQSGHKFIRMELRNDQEAPDLNWFFHLGSMDCVSTSPTQAPTESCGRPNLATIALDLDPTADTIVLDLDGLLDGVDIGSNTPDSPVGCMSHPLDAEECPQIFNNLGLSWTDGTCINGCSDQKAFVVR